MAQYNYEGGLASYFLLTFLSLILIPLTLSFRSSGATKKTVSCKCPECTKKDERLKKSGLSNVKLGPKLLITIVLWIVFGAVAYNAATTKSDTKIYNPFEILGIKAGTSEKDIKRHYKKLSIKFHPDKVKLVGNQTMDSIAAHFVELTKAYKSLTDETVRQNLEQYGHPDGKQEFSVGIAIPKWVVEGKNSMFVLAFYGAIFMGILPLVVGRWWFGSRGLTKDGVHGNTASLFFKSVTEDASIDFLVSLLSRGFSTEQKAFSRKVNHTAAVEDDLNGLETEIKVLLGSRWSTVAQTAKVPEARRALVLLYAHLLRLPVANEVLRKEQDTLILRAPTLLTSLLTMTLSRNWAASSLQLMHLHAYLAQAILPSPLIESPSTALLQYPNVKKEDTAAVRSGEVSELLSNLDKDTASSVRTAAASSGKLDIIDAKFKVIGERIITPNAIVNLLFRAPDHRPEFNGVYSAVAQWLGLSEPLNSGRWSARGLAVYPEGHGLNGFKMFLSAGTKAGQVNTNSKDIYWFISTYSSLEKDVSNNPELLLEEVKRDLAKNLPADYRTMLERTDLSTISWVPLLFRAPWNVAFGKAYNGCVTVAGDAMHPMTPDLAQGGCSALEDAVVLARCIGQTRRTARDDKQWAEKALKRYVDERRWRVTWLVAGAWLAGQMQAGTGGQRWWSGTIRWFRDVIYYGFVQPRTRGLIWFDCGDLVNPESKND